MKRLAILSTHPIQYNAPLFRMLHDEDGLDLHVFFSKTWEQVKYDPDFQQEVVWDIPVSEGYKHSTFDADTFTGKRQLTQAIHSFGPDALLVYGWNFPGHLHVMRKFKGHIPIWFRGDSHLLDPLSIWKRALRKVLLTWVYRHTDLVFSVGTANTDYFQWAGLDAEQIIIAPHAADNDFYSSPPASAPSSEELRSQWNIPLDEKVILFAGKFEEKKQPVFLLQAWRALSEPRPYLIFAGNGPLLNQIEAEAMREDKIRVVGFINQSVMPALYRCADLFCLPSLGPGETWGLCINESIASGTPCLVSSRAGCSKDLAPSDWVSALDPTDLELWSKEIRNALLLEERDQTWRTQFLQRHAHNAFATRLIEELKR